jgi:hypothetical protein
MQVIDPRAVERTRQADTSVDLVPLVQHLGGHLPAILACHDRDERALYRCAMVLGHGLLLEPCCQSGACRHQAPRLTRLALAISVDFRLLRLRCQMVCLLGITEASESRVERDTAGRHPMAHERMSSDHPCRRLDRAANRGRGIGDRYRASTLIEEWVIYRCCSETEHLCSLNSEERGCGFKWAVSRALADGRVSKSLLLDLVAGSFQRDDYRMGADEGDPRGGHGSVAEEVSPAGERHVARQDRRGVFASA